MRNLRRQGQTYASRNRRATQHRWMRVAWLLLAGFACATAWATAGGVVVGPRGEAAGGGYAHWLAVKDRLGFDTSAPGLPVCGSQRGPGGRIAFLVGGGHQQRKFSCGEPAGRPIYVDGLTNECSTLKGDHNGYGTSNAQLARCAPHGYQGLSASAWLDGKRITSYHKLLVLAPPVSFHLPKNNPFGIPAQSGRSVAYGEGLLLVGLSVGIHTVRITEKFPPPNRRNSNTVTYNLRITQHQTSTDRSTEHSNIAMEVASEFTQGSKEGTHG